MRRTLLCILLLINLLSGMAYAWDSHPEALAGHDLVNFDGATDIAHSHEHPSTGEWEHLHHCCHGAAHLIGLVYETIAPPRLVAGKPVSGQSASLVSPLLALPLRPPII